MKQKLQRFSHLHWPNPKSDCPARLVELQIFILLSTIDFADINQQAYWTRVPGGHLCLGQHWEMAWRSHLLAPLMYLMLQVLYHLSPWHARTLLVACLPRIGCQNFTLVKPRLTICNARTRLTSPLNTSWDLTVLWELDTAATACATCKFRWEIICKSMSG